jgi:hypothetical protein
MVRVIDKVIRSGLTRTLNQTNVVLFKAMHPLDGDTLPDNGLQQFANRPIKNIPVFSTHDGIVEHLDEIAQHMLLDLNVVDEEFVL